METYLTIPTFFIVSTVLFWMSVLICIAVIIVAVPRALKDKNERIYRDEADNRLEAVKAPHPNFGVKDCQCSESEAVDLDVLTMYDLNAIDEAHEN